MYGLPWNRRELNLDVDDSDILRADVDIDQSRINTLVKLSKSANETCDETRQLDGSQGTAIFETYRRILGLSYSVVSDTPPTRTKWSLTDRFEGVGEWTTGDHPDGANA